MSEEINEKLPVRRPLPTDDPAIHFLLGAKENADLLLHLINSVREHSGFTKIKSVSVKNPYDVQRRLRDKGIILDIDAEDDEGKKYDIEVQTSKYSAYKLRTLHYWARKYAGQIKSGEHYPELKPVISINIMGYKLIKETDKYHTCFQIREKDNRDIVLTDVFEMHFIELSKCAEQIEEAAINIHDPMETLEYAKKLLDIERWIWFFRYGGTEDKIMQAIAAIDETIGKANAKFREYTEEEWAEWEREAHQIYLLDREAIEEEIRQESRAEGSLAAKVETARNMLAEDFSIEQIAKLTGLSLSEVKKLKAED